MHGIKDRTCQIKGKQRNKVSISIWRLKTCSCKEYKWMMDGFPDFRVQVFDTFLGSKIFVNRMKLLK